LPDFDVRRASTNALLGTKEQLGLTGVLHLQQHAADNDH